MDELPAAVLEKEVQYLGKRKVTLPCHRWDEQDDTGIRIPQCPKRIIIPIAPQAGVVNQELGNYFLLSLISEQGNSRWKHTRWLTKNKTDSK